MDSPGTLLGRPAFWQLYYSGTGSLVLLVHGKTSGRSPIVQFTCPRVVQGSLRIAQAMEVALRDRLGTWGRLLENTDRLKRYENARRRVDQNTCRRQKREVHLPRTAGVRAFITAQIAGMRWPIRSYWPKQGTRWVVKMLKAISRASFQRSSTTHFGTLFVDRKEIHRPLAP